MKNENTNEKEQNKSAQQATPDLLNNFNLTGPKIINPTPSFLVSCFKRIGEFEQSKHTLINLVTHNDNFLREPTTKKKRLQSPDAC